MSVDTLGKICTDRNLVIFGRAHYSYINQIFGDITVRAIIQEVMKKKGKLLVEEAGQDFEHSYHHVFMDKKKVCSADEGYQNIHVDTNDTLCQSYSLLSYLKLPFDKTPSDTATVEQKHSKHMAMIAMYRALLKNKKFVKHFSDQIVFDENNALWKDTIGKSFNIIEHYKTGLNIIEAIEKVIDVWESYGWMYFIGKGKCIPRKPNPRV